MSRNLLAELEDVLLILGATAPAELNVVEGRSRVPQYEYMARCAERPRVILPISAAVAQALLSRGAVLETNVTTLETDDVTDPVGWPRPSVIRCTSTALALATERFKAPGG